MNTLELLEYKVFSEKRYPAMHDVWYESMRLKHSEDGEFTVVRGHDSMGAYFIPFYKHNKLEIITYESITEQFGDISADEEELAALKEELHKLNSRVINMNLISELYRQYGVMLVVSKYFKVFVFFSNEYLKGVKHFESAEGVDKNPFESAFCEDAIDLKLSGTQAVAYLKENKVLPANILSF